MCKNKKIIIVGKSASGKDYLLTSLVNMGYKRSVSFTTRPIRSGEIDGVTYNYVSNDEFESMINQNKLIEYHNFNNWYYGNTFDDFMNKNVFIKTIYGLNKISIYRNECFVIYIDIPIEYRIARLNDRKDTNDSINRRIISDEIDFKNFYDYDMKISTPNYNTQEIIDIISNLDI